MWLELNLQVPSISHLAATAVAGAATPSTGPPWYNSTTQKSVLFRQIIGLAPALKGQASVLGTKATLKYNLLIILIVE